MVPGRRAARATTGTKCRLIPHKENRVGETRRRSGDRSGRKVGAVFTLRPSIEPLIYLTNVGSHFRSDCLP